MITHRNAYLNIVGTLIHVHMTAADRYLWTLPMFHANGWTFVWIVTAVGGTHVCLRKVEPARDLRADRAASAITMLCAAPTVLIGIANAPDEMRATAPRGVRVLTAGAPPAAATIERVEGELGWDDHAGLRAHRDGAVHHGLRAAARARRAARRRSAPSIKARQGVELVTSGELRVVDEEGREVPHDGATLGEIVVRGNVVMEGYYNDPEATAQAMRGGWFHTGDAAVVHPDGYVEIRDRIKDVIISGGENISSRRGRGRRCCAIRRCRRSAVVGMPHEKWGEAPHAFVVLRAGATATEDELRAFVRERLAHFKCPQGFHFVAELPKTATGKIQKYVLRGGKPGIARQ